MDDDPEPRRALTPPPPRSSGAAPGRRAVGVRSGSTHGRTMHDEDRDRSPSRRPDEPRDLVESAFRIVREDPDGAEDRLRRAVRLAPADPTIRWALGRFLHDARNDIDQALDAYRAALAIAPQHLQALRDLARLHHYATGDAAAAERCYRRAVVAAPRRAGPRSDLATFIERVRGDMDEAEALHRVAIAAPDAEAETWSAWARFLHHVRRDAEGTRRAYARAVELAPDDADLRAWQAVFLQTLGKAPEAATEAYEVALALDPEHGFALSNYALHCSVHRPEDADPLFRRALAAEPDRWTTQWWYAAFLHQRGGDRARAAAHYRRAVELQPGHAALLRQYQRFLEDAAPAPVGDLPEPSGADAISDRGYAAEEAGRVEEAVALYREALVLDPSHGPTLRRLAALQAARGRIAEAAGLYRRTVELAPRDGWAHGLFARFLDRQADDVEGADRHYREALASGLHDPKWLGEYASFLHRRGEIERAAAYYSRALLAGAPPEVAVDHARFLERGLRDLDAAEGAFRTAVRRAPKDPFPVRQYARFLEESRGDIDGAEAQYLRAVTLAPADPLTLTWYARFLERVRQDDLRAAHYLVRAARAEPTSAKRWAAVVRFLVARGLSDEARPSLLRWRERLPAGDPAWAEVDFLGLVLLDTAEARAGCFDALKAGLAEGRQVGPFDPGPALALLAARGRGDTPFVRRMARVLRERMEG
jgi:tetratricopeptide (TPR) repeat protein